MDKTLEIVVAAAVLMMIAAVIFFLISSQTKVFTDSTNSQVNRADCKLWDARAENGDEGANEKYRTNNCDDVLGASSGDASPSGSSDCSGLTGSAYRSCVRG